MLVRPRADADVDRLLEIVGRTHEHDRYPALLPDDPLAFVVSKHEVAAWVAEVDGVVVGQVALLDPWGDDTVRAFVEAGSLGEVLILGRLYVDPEVRGTGAGRALLEAATSGAWERGRRPILDVVKGAEPAITMYEAAGWARAGELVREVLHHRFDEWVYLGPEPV